MKKSWKIWIFSENFTFWKIITGFFKFFSAYLFTEWLEMIVRWSLWIFRLTTCLVAAKWGKSWKKHEKWWYFAKNHDFLMIFLGFGPIKKIHNSKLENVLGLIFSRNIILYVKLLPCKFQLERKVFHEDRKKKPPKTLEKLQV